MEDWRSWQNGTSGGIAERDQVCLAGLPSPPNRVYTHTQPLAHLPVILQHCLRQTLQGSLMPLLWRLSPLSSCLGAPGLPFFLTQAQASYGAGSWPHHRMLWGVNLGDAALWKDMFSSQDSSAYSEQCLYWG